MVFSSVLFLTLFLPVVLTATSLLDYHVGIRLPPDRAHAHRRVWLTVAVLTNLLLLAYFKYANFLIAQTDALRRALGFAPWTWSAVVLPIGISFFTFQKISYLVDVFRGVAPPARQLDARDVTLEKVLSGLWRFCLGLAKKVLIANVVAVPADWAFGLPPAQLGAGAAWLGVLCHAVQIYFDFSGYSDMAIGLGRILGFERLENFDAPYSAANISDFWRRWHISLGTWMREYVYVPLGGNRHGAAHTYRNLWIAFLVSGLWHGAARNFVAWGAYHGTLLTAHRRVRRPVFGQSGGARHRTLQPIHPLSVLTSSAEGCTT